MSEEQQRSDIQTQAQALVQQRVIEQAQVQPKPIATPTLVTQNTREAQATAPTPVLKLPSSNPVTTMPSFVKITTPAMVQASIGKGGEGAQIASIITDSPSFKIGSSITLNKQSIIDAQGTLVTNRQLETDTMNNLATTTKSFNTAIANSKSFLSDPNLSKYLSNPSGWNFSNLKYTDLKGNKLTGYAAFLGEVNDAKTIVSTFPQKLSDYTKQVNTWVTNVHKNNDILAKNIDTAKSNIGTLTSEIPQANLIAGRAINPTGSTIESVVHLATTAQDLKSLVASGLITTVPRGGNIVTVVDKDHPLVAIPQNIIGKPNRGRETQYQLNVPLSSLTQNQIAQLKSVGFKFSSTVLTPNTRASNSNPPPNTPNNINAILGSTNLGNIIKTTPANMLKNIENDISIVVNEPDKLFSDADVDKLGGNNIKAALEFSAGSALSLGEIAGLALVAPEVLPAALGLTTGGMLVAAGIGAGLSEGVNLVTGQKPLTYGQLTNQALIGEGFAILGGAVNAGELKASTEIAKALEIPNIMASGLGRMAVNAATMGGIGYIASGGDLKTAAEGAAISATLGFLTTYAGKAAFENIRANLPTELGGVEATEAGSLAIGKESQLVKTYLSKPQDFLGGKQIRIIGDVTELLSENPTPEIAEKDYETKYSGQTLNVGHATLGQSGFNLDVDDRTLFQGFDDQGVGYRSQKHSFPTYFAPSTDPNIYNLYGGYAGIGSSDVEGAKLVIGGKATGLLSELTVDPNLLRLPGESDDDLATRLLSSSGKGFLPIENQSLKSIENQITVGASYERAGVQLPGTEYVSKGYVGAFQVRQPPENILGRIPILSSIFTRYIDMDVYLGRLEPVEGVTNDDLATIQKSIPVSERSISVPSSGVSLGDSFVSLGLIGSKSLTKSGVSTPSISSDISLSSDLADIGSVNSKLSELSVPSVPSAPSAPSTPSVPSELSESSIESNQSSPSTPSNPSTPSKPSSPSNQSNPSTPSKQSAPSTPSTPSNPSNPSNPSSSHTTSPQSFPSTPKKPTDRDYVDKPTKSLSRFKVIYIFNEGTNEQKVTSRTFRDALYRTWNKRGTSEIPKEVSVTKILDMRNMKSDNLLF